MLYWKHLTGVFIYNSYADDNGKFFFTHPNVFMSLFSYRKGWLLYTPVMLLLFPGLIFLWRRYRHLFWPVFIYFILNIWIVSSWYIPWYGGSFGQRAYIASYSILALAIGAFFASLLNKRKIMTKILGLTIAAIFVFHNFFQLTQFRHGAIHYISMTREAYWDSFGRSYPSPRFQYLLSFPDYKSAKNGIYPDPVIDPLYTGKLTEEEALIRIRSEVISELEVNKSMRMTLFNRSQSQNVSFYSLMDEEAKSRLNDKIIRNIILLRKE